MIAQSYVRHTAAIVGVAAALLPFLTRAGAASDPCTLLSASEAQAYVGALAAPPFRADDNGAANTRGSSCVYRGSAGKQISLEWNASGAQEAGNITESVPNTLGNVFDKAGQPGLGANAHRVIAQGPLGPWDKANWIPGGTLFVTKGDQGVNVDMSGASGSEDEAVAIAKLAVPRFNHPLAYDGARAAMNAPKTKAHQGACAIVTKAAVEAAIGPLSRAPMAGADGTSCEYHVATPQGQRSYSVEYVWQGGLKNYNMVKNSPQTMGAAMGGNIPMSGLDSIPQDAQTSAMLGGLMKMAGGDASAAPGAPAQVGFKTDSNLKGPWDQATLMHGTQLLAVKADVMVGMDLKSADYENAKALMVAICTNL
jgi:hypothetical protein